ncbi:hypothetical protein J6590_106535, partial [Homalodisca vitripennis]
MVSVSRYEIEIYKSLGRRSGGGLAGNSTERCLNPVVRGVGRGGYIYRANDRTGGVHPKEKSINHGHKSHEIPKTEDSDMVLEHVAGILLLCCAILQVSPSYLISTVNHPSQNVCLSLSILLYYQSDDLVPNIHPGAFLATASCASVGHVP